MCFLLSVKIRNQRAAELLGSRTRDGPRGTAAERCVTGS